MGIAIIFGFILAIVVVSNNVSASPTEQIFDTNARVIFHYGKSDSDHQAYKVSKSKDIIAHPEFDSARQTLLYIGDCFEVDDESTNVIVNAYKRRGRYNILTLDWSNLGSNDFFNILLPNMNDLASIIANQFILMSSSGLRMKDVHLIGFSIGAQFCGLIGRELIARSKNTVAFERITGLDPSSSGLNADAENADILVSLNEKDARFVDIILTDSGFYGTTSRNGTCRFWPNLGHRYQPGCSVANVYNPILAQHDLCSHKRAYLLWAESVLAKDDTTFLAVAAPSFKAFRRGQLNLAHIAVMGINCSPNTPGGDYYLQTNAAPLYSRGVAGLNNDIAHITN